MSTLTLPTPAARKLSDRFFRDVEGLASADDLLHLGIENPALRWRRGSCRRRASASIRATSISLGVNLDRELRAGSQRSGLEDGTGKAFDQRRVEDRRGCRLPSGDATV